MTYYLYILKLRTVNKYYVGISANPYPRLKYHNIIEKESTSRDRPWKIVFISVGFTYSTLLIPFFTNYNKMIPLR